MKWLIPLLLAQNINVTPIETRQNGVRVPQRVVQRQYVIDCRVNMTCGVDAGVLYLSAASGSGGGYDGGKVGEAFMADASITAQMFDHDPTACPAGEYASDQSSAGVLTCSAPPSGSGNFVEAEVDFGSNGDTTASVAVAATWVGATSTIVCAPTLFSTTDRADGVEDAVIEGLTGTPGLRMVGVGFTLVAHPAAGRAVGKFKFHCTGG